MSSREFEECLLQAPQTEQQLVAELRVLRALQLMKGAPDDAGTDETGAGVFFTRQVTPETSLVQTMTYSELDVYFAGKERVLADLRRGRPLLAILRRNAQLPQPSSRVDVPDVARRRPEALEPAARWLKTAEVFVSKRIADEELGDAHEALQRFHREGRPAWHLYVHAVLSIVRAVWHTWGDLVSAMQKKSG